MDYPNEFPINGTGVVLKLRDDLKQGHIEKFEIEINAMPHLFGVTNRGTSSRNGAILRSAIAADWIIEPEAEKVKVTKQANGKSETEVHYLFNGERVHDMHPGQVSYIGKHIGDIYDQLTDISPFF